MEVSLPSVAKSCLQPLSSPPAFINDKLDRDEKEEEKDPDVAVFVVRLCSYKPRFETAVLQKMTLRFITTVELMCLIGRLVSI